MWQVVEIVIGGVATVLDVRFMCLFMALGGILLQGSVSRNLFGPVWHRVDLRKVEVGIKLLGNIHLAPNIIQPGVYFSPRL
jgi:hypothetical protein